MANECQPPRPASGRHQRRPDRRLQRFPRRRNPGDDMLRLKASRSVSLLPCWTSRPSGHLADRRQSGSVMEQLSRATSTDAKKGRRTRWEGYRVRLSRGRAKARLRDGITPISRARSKKVQSPPATFDRLCNKVPGVGSRGMPCRPCRTASAIRHLLSPSCYRRAMSRGPR